MDATTFTTGHPGASTHICLHDTLDNTLDNTHDNTHDNSTTLPQTYHNTTAVSQTQQPTDTFDMPFLTFKTGPNYYGYKEGVNAANLTSQDIKAANARLAPMRHQRIKGGLLKATRDDPSYLASEPVAHEGSCDYAKWTKYEMLEAMVARGLATKRTRVHDMHKDKMVARLVKADEDSSFPHFMELSPELREMVYGYAMENKARTRPAPPPICRTSQLIRAESLPIFFQNVTMNVHVFQGSSDEPPYEGDYVVVGPSRRSMHISKAYLEYFAYATKHHWIEHMRHFQWYVSTHDSVMPGHLKRHRTNVVQYKYTKLMESVQVSLTFKINGRSQCIEGMPEKNPDKKDEKMSDRRFAFMVAYFMGAHVNLNAFLAKRDRTGSTISQPMSSGRASRT